MRFGLGIAAAAVLAAGAAGAEPLTARAARGMVFEGAETTIEILPHPKLPADQAALLSQVAVGQPYYGAIAFSPDEGIMVEATVAAVSHHSFEAAAAAAAAGCDAKRKGRSRCAVVVKILPKGWEARPLTLSAAASEALRKDYGRSGRRAMAVSPATGAFGLGRGEGAEAAALAACGKPDCAIAVAD